MKSKLIIPFIAVTALILTLSVYFAMNITASEKKSGNAVIENQKEKLCCTDLKIDHGKVGDNSIYQLDSKWRDESGKTISLADLKGKKQIMAMIFTSCTYACPLILNDMKKIESQTKSKDVNYLLVSIDPARDTPEALKSFAERNNLDLNKWRLITGNQNGISELAAVLGFRYKKEKDGSFSHSNIISVLNENGEIAFQHFGLNQSIQDVLNSLKEMEN